MLDKNPLNRDYRPLGLAARSEPPAAPVIISRGLYFFKLGPLEILVLFSGFKRPIIKKKPVV